MPEKNTENLSTQFAASGGADDSSPPAERVSLQALVFRIKRVTGVDRAIAFTVMGRGWAAGAGLVNVLLIAHFLSPAEQGYYYTFSSLVALQVVFELGFSFVVLQLASHEVVHLSLSPDGHVEGDPVAHARLASVLQKSVRWYSVAALLMLSAVLPAGLYFFAVHQTPRNVPEWRFPLSLMVVAATITFQVDPIFSFLEGCGYVPQVARMRMCQSMVGGMLAWSALITHRGLFAPGMMIIGQALVGVSWLMTRRGLLLGLLRYNVGNNRVSWRSEIWPFQWRIAVSWLCGYLVIQLFNPVLFAYQGPAAAGRMGMSLSICASPGAVAIAWMTTKAAPFGALIARQQFEELDHLFFRTLKQSTALLLSGSALLWACLLFTVHQLPMLAARVLSPWALALLLLTTICNHFVFSEALYLRAHKREPFLIPSLLVALVVSFNTVLLGRNWGANGVTVGYFFGSGILGLGMGTYIFLTKRRQWHRSLNQALTLASQSCGW